MTPVWIVPAFVVLGAVAVIDWWAVATGVRRVEVVAKPAVLIVLTAVAAGVDGIDGRLRLVLVAGLILSLAGDVFLLFDSTTTFIAGLASFLVAHVAYVVAFLIRGVTPTGALIGVGLVVIGLGVLARPIVGGVKAREQELAVPVVAYMAVISAMVVAAAGTGDRRALVGAVLFYLSDAAIAWTRFVADHRYGRLFVMVTYHVGQALIVVSFA